MFCLVGIKACKRCGGDLFLERDLYGTYTTCIQCGASLNKYEMKYTSPRRRLSDQQLAKTKNATAVCTR